MHAIPLPTEDKFPTPAEARAKHNAIAAPRIAAVIAKIRAAIENSDGSRVIVDVSWEMADRDAIRNIIEPSGWVVSFHYDQREGQCIEITPR